METKPDMPPINLPNLNPEGASAPNAEGYIFNSPISPEASAVATGPSQQNQAQSLNTPIVSTPSVADDVDMIEKEWIEKINEILRRTQGEPFDRANQLALLKSDYLQKRYQKNVKIV